MNEINTNEIAVLHLRLSMNFLEITSVNFHISTLHRNTYCFNWNIFKYLFIGSQKGPKLGLELAFPKAQPHYISVKQSGPTTPSSGHRREPSPEY